MDVGIEAKVEGTRLLPDVTPIHGVPTAVAKAQDPVLMAGAMRCAVEAGRAARRAGRIPKRDYGEPSSPQLGLIGS